MDENTKKIQTEIAKDKIQIILASIALAVLVIMEFYIMINFKSNFMAMAVGILLMIVALFFLISAILDISLKQKSIEQEKYEEIYNAQKASYLVIKKSFDEMDQRLRTIEENSALPAEDIINAQKAVAKVTISRSKENTDALMNSNDELINQLVNIQEKLESNNSQIIEKQQSLLKESNFDIQQKIAALTSQISNIEGRIQSGIPVMAQQVQMVPPVMPTMDDVPKAEEGPVEDVGLDLDAVKEEIPAMDEPVMEEPVAEEIPAAEEIPSMDEAAAMEESVEDIGLDLDAVVEEEPAAEEAIAEETSVEDVGFDLDAVTEETPVMEESVAEEIPEAEEMPVIEESAAIEEPIEDIGLDLDAVVEEEPEAEEMPSMEETVAIEEPVEDIGIDLDAVVEEEPAAEETIAEETSVEDVGLDLDAVTEETPVMEEMPVMEEPVAEEIPEAEEMPTIEETPAIEEPVQEEIQSDDPGANLDALLEEIGEPVEEPEPEPTPEPEPAPEEKADDSIVIPDVGVDLTDPNRVMSPEEIEKLFANI